MSMILGYKSVRALRQLEDRQVVVLRKVFLRLLRRTTNTVERAVGTDTLVNYRHTICCYIYSNQYVLLQVTKTTYVQQKHFVPNAQSLP